MADYYVSTSGNDATGTGAIGAPWRTIAYAAAHSGAGDTVLARGAPTVNGIYAESIGYNFPSGTGWSNTWRLMAYPGETVWLRPATGPTWVANFETAIAYVELDGINLDSINATDAANMGGLAVEGPVASHVRFQNAEIIGNRLAGNLATSRVGVDLNQIGGDPTGFNEIINVRIHRSAGNNSYYGVYIHSSDNLIDGCEIYDVGMIGVTVYNSYPGAPPSSRNTIRNNNIHDIEQAYDGRRFGINPAGDDALVYNNLVWNLDTTQTGDNVAALYFYTGNRNKCYYNTFANVRGNSIVIYATDGCEIIGTISYNNFNDNITDQGLNTNLFTATNLFGIDPLFADGNSGNFQLRAGSPAINAGLTVSAVTVDYLGRSRPQGTAYCIGAYEYAQVTWPWTFVNVVKGGDGADTVTTSAVSSVTANLIVIHVGRYVGTTTTLTVSDSEGNTWTAATRHTSTGDFASQLFYCIAPAVDAAHTFTANCGAASGAYPNIEVEIWSVAGGSPTVGTENGAVGVGSPTTLQTGSVTITDANSMAFAGLMFDGNDDGAVSIDLGFTPTTQPFSVGVSFGGSIAYLFVPSPAAKNPQWNMTNATREPAASILWFKPALAGFGALLSTTRNQHVIG